MDKNATWYNKLPDENLKVYEPYLKLFFETMYERQMIWKRRFIDKKPQPWTDNEIFRNSKFTNVYRELDRHSQWEIQNIILDDALSLKDLVWKILVFRTFNKPETFMFHSDEPEVISADKWQNGIPSFDEFDVDEYYKFIQGVRAAGNNPFTSAYLLSNVGYPRDYYYTHLTLKHIHDNFDDIFSTLQNAKSPQEIINKFKQIPGAGKFIAHEYYQDMTYIERYTGKKLMPFGANDFTNVGPGSESGIRLIYPNLKKVSEKLQGIYRLKDIASEQLQKISEEHGEQFPYLWWNKEAGEYYISDKCNITLNQIEMWLCEFQKYWKMVIGEGKQRSKFIPHSTSIVKR